MTDGYDRIEEAKKHMYMALDLLQMELYREDPSGINHSVGPLDTSVIRLAGAIEEANYIGCA